MEIENPSTAPKITTNLFSFKTFRSPDKIAYSQKNQFFIHHPDLEEAIFNPVQLSNIDETKKIQHDDFIKRLKPIKHYKEIRDINKDFYDYSCQLMEQRRNDSSRPLFEVEPPLPLTDEDYLTIWDELFTQITIKESITVRQACIQLIITQFYVENQDRLSIKDVSKLAVVIPDVFIEWVSFWDFSKCGGKLFGVKNLGIQEYRRVEQTLCCYVPGEISHIENIMAKEYKEKSTRNLLRTENTTEFSTETEIENLNDTTTSERNELSTETAKELQKDKSFDVSGSVSVSKETRMFGTVSANASTGYNNSSSSSLSNTEAKNYAKEITERALERVVQKTSEKRTFKMIKEFEENNKHGFDNRGGGEHVTGVYRWVDKIYDNQLVNYGKRLVLEIDVPHPALLYKKAMEWKSKDSELAQNTLTPPKPLSEFGINAWTDVTNESITSASLEYGVSIDSYVESVLYKDVTFTAETEHKSKTKTDIQASILVDTGYVADRIDGIGTFQHNGSVFTPAYLRINIANAMEIYRGPYNSVSNETDTFGINLDLSPNVVGSISFSISYRQTRSYNGTFKVKMISDPALFRDWQEEALLTLQTAYQGKLDAYNEELKLQQAAQQAEADSKNNESYNNPSMNRLIEERELKRAAVEMMSKPYCYELGLSFNECKTYTCKSNCTDDEEISANVPVIIQNQELEDYARFIKFFETAFQWEILSYIFYPYYYNEKCRWYELLQTKNPDPIFEAFLQSGLAKILVPIRPQFEKAVLWYLETGEITPECDLVPETQDDRYESILSDLGNQDEVIVEGKWKTRIPSTLTIIQAESAYFKDEKGLPCCDDETSAFGSDGRVMQERKDIPAG